MSNELIAILVVGAAMGIAEFAAIVIAISGFGAISRQIDGTARHLEATLHEMSRENNRSREDIIRMQQSVAALVVQESERIQSLSRG